MAALKSSFDELREAARAESNLGAADFLTIADLLQLSGYADEALELLLICLFSAYNDGCCRLKLSREPIARRLATFLDSDAAAAWAERILETLDRQPFAELVSYDPDAYTPLIVHSDDGQRCIYFQKYLRNVLRVRANIDARLDQEAANSGGTSVKNALNDVLKTNPWMREGKAVELSEREMLAVLLGLIQNFLVVSGGPGTGKTSIVFTLLRALLRLGFSADRIRLAAPTGRAAQRMSDFLRAGLKSLKSGPAMGPDSELSEISAGTLHRILKYNPTTGTFAYNARNFLPADVVIVDEVSMVDVVMMSRLLSALPSSAKLILLGDKDQLPSVEAGAVLPELLRMRGRPLSRDLLAIVEQILEKVKSPETLLGSIVILEENYRSQKQILTVANAVNAQDISIVEQLPRLELLTEPGEGRPRWPTLETLLPGQKNLGGCWLLESHGRPAEHSRTVCDAWAEHHYFECCGDAKSYVELVYECSAYDLQNLSAAQSEILRQLFARLDLSRVLTLVRDGPFGCDGINDYFQRMLRSRMEPRCCRTGPFAGAPVMITRNDHSRQLYNGDVGVVLGSVERGYRAVFSSHEAPVSYALDSLPAWEYAFAITVHKSQGSEYGRVLLVLPNEECHRLLTKEMIYTGITRAKTMVAIYGGESVLKAAISRNSERD